MRRSDVVQQSRRVVRVERRHRDVDDPAGAVEGLLECLVPNVLLQRLSG